MIGLIRNSLRHLYQVILNPEEWGLDVPLPQNGSGKLEPGQRWRRTVTEIPVLKNQMRRSPDPRQIEVDYVFQYRATFRFAGSLKYDQLPIRKLSDILEYINFLISTHPGLLSSSPARIDEMLGWVYPRVDPCLYLDGVSTDPQSKLTIRVVSVNGFMPIVEQEATDWVVTLVWSIECSVSGDVADFRQYFQDVLGGDDQILTRPQLTGGSLDRLPFQVDVGLYRDMPE